MGSRRIILDAGSGLAELGTATASEPGPVNLDLLLTHMHYDHICGLPFFAPLFRPNNEIRIWSGRLEHPAPAAATLRASMTPPLMPDIASQIRAQVAYREFDVGSVLDLGGGVMVRTAMLSHPGGCVAYRIEGAGQSVVYATDTAHGEPETDASLRALCEGAGPADLRRHADRGRVPAAVVGWGHSTWREGVRLAEACGTGPLVLFHHAPFRDDKAVAALAGAAAAIRPGTIAARERMELTLGGSG